MGYSLDVLWTNHGENHLGRVPGRRHHWVGIELPSELDNVLSSSSLRVDTSLIDRARTPSGRHTAVR